MRSTCSLALPFVLFAFAGACSSGGGSTPAATPPLHVLTGKWTIDTEVTFVTLTPGVPCERKLGEKETESATLTQTGDSIKVRDLALGEQTWTMAGSTVTGTSTSTDAEGTTTVTTSAAVTATTIHGTRVTVYTGVGSPHKCHLVEKLTATKRAASNFKLGEGKPDVLVIYDDDTVEYGWTRGPITERK